MDFRYMDGWKIKTTSPASASGSQASYPGNKPRVDPWHNYIIRTSWSWMRTCYKPSLVTVSIRVISLADAFPGSPPIPNAYHRKRGQLRNGEHGIWGCVFSQIQSPPVVNCSRDHFNAVPERSLGSSELGSGKQNHAFIAVLPSKSI